MIGLIDIGNTRLKWALYDDSKVGIASADGLSAAEQNRSAENAFIAEGAFSYKGMTADQIKQELDRCFVTQPSSEASMLENNGLSRNALSKIVVSSVGPSEFLDLVVDQSRIQFDTGVDILKVTSEMCGITNAYNPITFLGIDRWMSVIGARTLVDSGDVIVIDSGTAIKIECLSRLNVYEGGVILPGFDLMHDCLVSSTSKIKSQKVLPTNVIGKNTIECVNAGAHYGVGGAVDRIVGEIKALIGLDTPIVLTGGSAPRLKSVMESSVDRLDSRLIFKGMARVVV